MSFARIVAVAGSVLWYATASAGGPLRPFKHGFWTGGAYTDDRTGAFTHCSAGIAYSGEMNLFVLLTGGYRWWLGFTNPKWDLAPNARVSVKLQLDDAPAFSGLASTPSGQLLLVSLPDNPNLLDAFHRSQGLTLDVEGKSFSFKLSGTPVVMEQLAKCVRTSVALEAQALRTAASAASHAKIAPAGAASSAPSAHVGSAAVTASGSSSAQTETAPAIAAAVQPQISLPDPTNASSLSRKSGLDTASGSSVLHLASDSAAPTSTAEGAPRESATAGSAAPTAETASPAQAVTSAAKSASNRAGESLMTPLSSASAQPTPPAPEKPATVAEPRWPSSAAQSLAFTSVAPATPAPRSAATASEQPPEPATGIALEEVQLATDFFTKARLPDARLVVADKPPALADFAAVWRSEDAAGAVKIIPPGPDVSGIDIASNMIAVDPQLCKGNFSAARFRTEVGNSVVFSAILSCSEEKEQRVTEYFITPRHQGGFIVFAVIRSKAVDETPGFDWQKIDVLSRAAVQAAEGQG